MNQNDDEISSNELKQEVNRIKQAIEPYQKPLLYIFIILFLFLVGFVGFLLGGYQVCVQVDGFLDSNVKCHLDYNEFGNPKDAINIRDSVAPEWVQTCQVPEFVNG